jgi:hypothetical protein
MKGNKVTNKTRMTQATAAPIVIERIAFSLILLPTDLFKVISKILPPSKGYIGKALKIARLKLTNQIQKRPFASICH